MSDIELVVKISEDSYKATCSGSMLPPDVKNVVNAIKNGKLHEERLLYIEDVFRLVEGHSIYSGDSILSAFTCLSEGKDIKDITPLDVSFAEIADLRRETHNE